MSQATIFPPQGITSYMSINSAYAQRAWPVSEVVVGGTPKAAARLARELARERNVTTILMRDHSHNCYFINALTGTV